MLKSPGKVTLEGMPIFFISFMDTNKGFKLLTALFSLYFSGVAHYSSDTIMHRLFYSSSGYDNFR